MSIFLTPTEAADRLGVVESTLRRKSQSKEWPSHKVGRHLRFTDGDLEQIATLTAVAPANPFQTTRTKRRAS